MKTIILIVTSLIFLSGSCNKDKNVKTVVNGKVINAGNNLPINGAQVDLRELYGFASNTGFNVIETTTTDINGNFKFNFVATPSRSYNVIIDDLDLYLSQTVHSFKLKENIDKGKVNDVLLSPMKFAYSKMIIDGSEGADSMRLESSHEFVDTFGGDRLYYAGDFFESSMSKGVSGKVFYKITRFLNGVETVEYDTVNRIPYQEHLVEIKF